MVGMLQAQVGYGAGPLDLAEVYRAERLLLALYNPPRRHYYTGGAVVVR